MNSDTPETDAATFWGRDMGNDNGPPHFECVDADFARTLERENVVLRQMLQRLEETGEINPSNYNHDEVVRLNNAVNEAVELGRKAITPPTTI